MRIRRYAARLLASSGPAASSPSSPPPRPDASWLHHAAADDCAICKLSRPDPQVASDGIKHKGHIAGRVLEGELRSDDRIGLAHGPPVPEAQGCKIDDGTLATGLDVTRGASSVIGAPARLEGTEDTILVSEVATKPAVTEGAFIVNEATDEQEVGGKTSLVNECATEPEVTGGASILNGLIAEPEAIMGASLANEAVAEREVLERVSLVSEAATDPAAVTTVTEVTRGACLGDEGAAEPEVKMGDPRGNESAAKMEVVRITPLVNEAATHPGLTEGIPPVSEVLSEPGVTVTVLEVTEATSLDNENVSMEPEITGGPSLLNEAAELEIMGGTYIGKGTAAALEVTVGASVCSGDGDATLNEPQLPDCYLDMPNVQVENAGEALVSTAYPSRDDAVDTVDSINSTSNGPVRHKSPSAEEVAPCDEMPSVSCVSGIVARSIGTSGRTDIICYARRRVKRKVETGIKTEEMVMDDGAVYDQCEGNVALERTVPCESVMSTAGSTEIKLTDMKRELVDNSSSSKSKKRKVQRLECGIDYCRMTFKTRAELSMHKKNLCTVKSCGRHFRSHNYLRRHQSIHNDYLPYKCPWDGCSMAFKWTWARAEHFQVHIGERPYKCTTPGCGRIYKFVSDFTRHWRRCKLQRVLTSLHKHAMTLSQKRNMVTNISSDGRLGAMLSY